MSLPNIQNEVFDFNDTATRESSIINGVKFSIMNGKIYDSTFLDGDRDYVIDELDLSGIVSVSAYAIRDIHIKKLIVPSYVILENEAFGGVTIDILEIDTPQITEEFNCSCVIHKVICGPSVKRIGSPSASYRSVYTHQTFGECGGIEFKGDLEFIGCYAFNNANLGKLVLPKVDVLSDTAFYGAGITELELGSDITLIPSKCFSLNLLTTIHIPSQITCIESEAFSSNNECKSITFDISSTLTTIESKSFHRYSSGVINDIHIPSTVTHIGEEAFEGIHINTLTFDPNVKCDISLIGVDVDVFMYDGAECIIYNGDIQLDSFTKDDIDFVKCRRMNGKLIHYGTKNGIRYKNSVSGIIKKFKTLEEKNRIESVREYDLISVDVVTNPELGWDCVCGVYDSGDVPSKYLDDPYIITSKTLKLLKTV